MSRIAPVVSSTVDAKVATTLTRAEARVGVVPNLFATLVHAPVALATWINDRNVPFLISSIGMVVMLLWAGSYKMTRPGAEGIIPLVANSPLIWWHFRLFGPYIGADLIGLTEWLSALLIIAGYFKPRAGILGGLVGVVIFFTTSTMFISTPGAIISVPGIPGMRYMSFLGLFLFKDVLALGVSLYLISYFGKKAILSEDKC